MHVGPALRDYLRPLRGEMLEALETLVLHESPSRDEEALNTLARSLMGRFREIGAEAELIANPEGGDHVRVRFGGEDAPNAPPALVLCHFDTVWPSGTLETLPFRVEDGKAYGPGTFDMKASLVLLEHALRAIKALGLRPPRPVVALLTSDEEIGSPASRPLIEAEARGCSYALVMEAPLPGGRLKSGRKGVGRFTLEVIGRAAHAGVEPEKGLSAIQELAHQVLRLHALGDAEAGTTVNVGVVQGGTTANVVAGRAEALIDVRVWTSAEAERIEAAMRSLEPATPGVGLVVGGGFNRPPMERTPAVAGLFARARRVGETLGLDLTEGSTGGASDGNFTAALGVPTLDGLGALGAGAHAVHEHIEIDSLPERAALLAALLVGLS